MGLLDDAKDKMRDAGDAAGDARKDLENRTDKLENQAYEKKGEMQAEHPDYDPENR